MSALGLMLPGIAPIRQPASSSTMSVAPAVEAGTQQSHVTKSDIAYRGLHLLPLVYGVTCT